MNINLTGKTALVCGASQGIGLAIAEELALLGARICLMARNEEKLIQAKNSLPGSGHTYVIADAQKPETFESILLPVINDFGKINILINNSGGPAPGPAHLAESEQFLSAFNQHLVANHTLLQLVLPSMKKSGYGRIINVISTSVKQPLPNLGVSNTIRGAVANWSKTLANELAQFGITVNNVLPGATATDRLENIINNKAAKTGKSYEEVSNEMKNEIPAKRFAYPDEVAAAAAFLASPAAAYINGVNIPVDGGRTSSL
jgi:3-oxoacyl-[acyl-carrier protein] reductase